MNTKKKKSSRFLGGILLLAFSVLLLWTLGSVMVYFKSGAEKESVIGFDFYSNHTPLINWDSTDNTDSNFRKQIETAYKNCWQAFNTAKSNRDALYLKDHFSENIIQKISFGLKDKIEYYSQQVDLEHSLKINLISPDYQFVSLTDSQILIKKEIHHSESGHISSFYDTLNANIILERTESRWKIKQMEFSEAIQNKVTQFVDTSKTEELNLSGVNYYPAENPWFGMWNNYDEDLSTVDLSRIKSMGFNHIRIFIPYELFGASEIKLTEANKLRHLLDYSDDIGLKCVVTLFDFPPPYSLSYYSRTDQHLSQLLSMFADHPAIYAWDLKNEPDLDFKAHGKNVVLEWLDRKIMLFKSLAPKSRLTIGWSDPAVAHLHHDKLDYISFHFYRPLKEFEESLKQIKLIVRNKNICLQEFGMSTYNSWYVPGGHSEVDQYNYYLDIMKYITQYELSYSLWSFYDFETVPSYVTGGYPWRKNRQAAFGILDTSGNKKKAASIFSDTEQPQKIKVAYLKSIKPFYLTIIIALAIGMISLFLLWKYKT